MVHYRLPSLSASIIGFWFIIGFTINPVDLGLAECAPSDLLGGERAENAQIVTSILDRSDRGHRRNMVLLNTGAALTVAGIAPDIAGGIAKAAEAIDSGKALAKLNALRELK